MEFLVLWLGTSIASFCIEVANELRMLKDVADEGYKVDSNRLSELANQINPDMSKNVFLSMLMPFYNVAQVLQRTMKYNNARPMVLDQLRIMDALEEMSEYEKKEYQKNPTGLNAFLVPIKNKLRFEKATLIKFTNEEGLSTIYYDFDKSNDEIVIIKVTGPYSRLTEEEQKRKVMDAWKSILKAEKKNMEMSKHLLIL